MHAGLSEKEKMSICSALNHEKLSAELLRHLTRNLVFPSEAKPRAHVAKLSRMKTLLQENDHVKNIFDSMFRKSFKNIDVKEDVESRIHDAEDLKQSSEVQKLRGDLEGTESEKKSGINVMNNATYLPKLCS